MSWISLERSRFIELLYPLLTVVVAARSKSGISAMPAAWNTPLSMDPPLVGIVISPERFTYKLIVESKEYTINIFPYEYVDKVSLIGDVSARYMKDKLTKLGFTVDNARSIGAPLLKEAIAVVECKLKDLVEVGDHDLLVGEVIDAYVKREFITETLNFERYKPILYLGRVGKPKEVKRVYTTIKPEVHKTQPASSIVKEYVEKRKFVNADVRRFLERTKTPTKDDIVKLARKHGLEVDDILYIMKSFRRT